MKTDKPFQCEWCSSTFADIREKWTHQGERHGYEKNPVQEFALALESQPKVADAPFSLSAQVDRTPRERQIGLFF